MKKPQKKRVAKRQRYWKSSEPGCLATERDTGSHRKNTTDKVTQRYVVHVHVPVATVPTVTIDIMLLLHDV